MARHLLLIAALLAARAAFAADPAMGSGGCADYSWDMKREFFLLGTAPLSIAAVPARDEQARFTPLDRPFRVALRPQAEVGLLAEPGRSHDAAASHGGLLRLVVPRVSTYRISSDQRLWIDVVGPQGVVKSSKFEMQTGCDKLVKSVAFRLEQDTDYWLQLSGSPAREPMLLITLDR
jgi:hypothetical protein